MLIFYFRRGFFIFLFCLILLTAGIQILSRKMEADPLFLFSELQAIGSNFTREVSDIAQKYLFLLNLREANKRLKGQNQELKARLGLFKEIQEENDRLKRVLGFSRNSPFGLLPAQVVGTDFLSKNELLTINKGRADGVRKLMGVVSPEGAVGYIFRTSPHSSQVISLLNPLSSLPARNRRSRVSGLLSPYRRGELIFHFLDRAFSEERDDLKIGDAIVTAPTEQLPSGVLAGWISAIRSSSASLNSEAYVQPAVRFYSLEEVLVVLRPFQKTDFSAPPAPPEKSHEPAN